MRRGPPPVGRPRSDSASGPASRSTSIGRNSASGTYGFFKKKALKKGDYKDTVKEQPGSAAVVQGVYRGPRPPSATPASATRRRVCEAVPALGRNDGEDGVRGRLRQRRRGHLPARPLPLPLHRTRAREGRSPPIVREFLRYVFSKEGQEVVVKDGYLPLDELHLRQGARASSTRNSSSSLPGVAGRPSGTPSRERDARRSPETLLPSPLSPPEYSPPAWHASPRNGVPGSASTRRRRITSGSVRAPAGQDRRTSSASAASAS